MKVTINDVNMGDHKWFFFHKGSHFFSCLSRLAISKNGRETYVTAHYSSLITYQKQPGQIFVWIGRMLLVLSRRRPFIHMEVFDVGNDDQAEL